MNTRLEGQSDAGGQFITAGTAVASLGGLGLVLAAVTSLAGITLAHLETSSLAVTALLLMATGGMMVETGRHHDEG